MTNQDAIIELQHTIDLIKQDGKDWLDERDIPILEAAISALQAQEETVSRKVYEQISWERDIAVMQLKDLGYSLGEKIRTDGDTISRQALCEYALNQKDKSVTPNDIMRFPSVQPETCEGCKHLGKWENEVEYGYPSPCTRCKRRVNDNYER